MTVDTISVIIPAKNREMTIVRAIDSVLAQKGNFSLEIIVVDDASTDKTKEIVNEYYGDFHNIRIVENEKSVGGAVARNIGARTSSGRFIAFLDSDDEWLPGHLKNKMEVLKAQNADGIFGSFNIVFHNRIKPMNLPAFKTKDVESYIFEKRGDTRTSTFLFIKDAFMNIMFDNNLPKHQDWDLAIRFAEKYNLVMDYRKMVNIYVNVDNRMSNKNNYAASDYFLQKHQEKLSDQGLYNFKLNLCFNIFRFEGVTKDFNARLKELSVMERKKNGVEHRKKYYLLQNRFLRFLLPIMFVVKKKIL